LEKKNKGIKRLKLFDIARDGKGVSKRRAELGTGFKRFFHSYKNNFGKLISVNIIMVLANFPLLFLVAVLSGLTKTNVLLPFSDLFQNINGIIQADPSVTPYEMTLVAIGGLQKPELVPTVWTYIFYGISSFALLTFGPVNASCTYILRNIASGEPVFVWSDFIYSFKRNIKQSLIFGVIDALIICILGFNIYITIVDPAMMFFAFAMIVIAVLYFMMRSYVYLQMVTFKLTIFKMIKNSMKFALLGFKRNIIATLGVVIIVVIEAMLLFLFNGILMPFAIAGPLAILFSTSAYMCIFAAYYKIKELMIDPYYREHPEEMPSSPEDEEIIMSDDVTYNEHLEEIKKKNGIE